MGYFSADEKYLTARPAQPPVAPPAPAPPPPASVAPAAPPAPAPEPAPIVQGAPVPPPVGPLCPQPGCGAPLRVGASGHLACAYCGAQAALRDDGLAVALESLLYGACSCCRPRRPLIRVGERIICPAHPEQASYPPAPGPRQQEPPAQQPEMAWDAIDRALRDNSAFLGTHGLFIRNR